jgi:type I pantothenate kinase
LHETTSTFLGTLTPRVPFVIGVAGSVAVGKSTTSRVLQALLARWPSHPRVEVVTTDGFLFSNEVLNARNMMHRKGFPESYDVRRLVAMLHRLKSGAPTVEVPQYSHVTYDVAPTVVAMQVPDIVIVEGINVLQIPPTRDTLDDRFVSDYFDFSIYVDADEPDVRQWYVDRTFHLRDLARADPSSFFGFLVPMDDAGVEGFADMIWSNVNGVNLRENILPTRSRADLILEKGRDHAVANVKLRKR